MAVGIVNSYAFIGSGQGRRKQASQCKATMFDIDYSVSEGVLLCILQYSVVYFKGVT